MALFVLVVVCCVYLPGTLARPSELCAQGLTHGFSTWNSKTHKDNNSHKRCLDEYFLDLKQTSHYTNMTTEALSYVNSLMRKVLSDSPIHRFKRQADTRPRRLRREVRTLSQREWNSFANGVNRLKRQRLGNSNYYDVIANLHRGWVIRSAHDGPNFLGWHRIYLLVFEAAVGIPIPYWDSSMDFHMDDPTQSVVWTSYFFGTGFGRVDDGPFGNWMTANGIPLVRNIGNDGSLISKEAIALVLSRRLTREIVEPLPDPQYSLEGYHNGPHVWVDGQFSSPETAAQDPVFFLHHAFVDYIWEMFRSRQRMLGVDPDSDYPQISDALHHPRRLMDGWPYLPRLRNIDGFSEQYAQMAMYESSPSCRNCINTRWPFPVMRCDEENRRCISATVVMETERGELITTGNSPSNIARARASVVQIGPLPIGSRFRSIFRDPRVRGDPLPNALETT